MPVQVEAFQHLARHAALGVCLAPAETLLRVHLAGVDADHRELLLGAFRGVRAVALAVVIVGDFEALAVHA